MIRYNNKEIFIKGVTSQQLQLIKKITTYKKKGFQYAPSYKEGRWNGFVYFLKYLPKLKSFKLPIGFLKVLKFHFPHFEYRDECVKKFRKNNNIIFKKTLRNYQEEALMVSKVEPRGIFKMPVRSGKTVLASALIADKKVPTLFIVPNITLLHQTVAQIKGCLDLNDSQVGVIGGGCWREGFVTVATIQSLIAKLETFYNLCKKFGMIIFDECHHVKGSKIWSKLVYSVDVYYKYGLSATIWLDENGENEGDMIWCRACFGDIIYEVSYDQLIADKRIVKPQILFIKIDAGVGNGRWDKEFLRECINNTTRNQIIINILLTFFKMGKKILVITNRKTDQLKLLELYSEMNGIPLVTLSGDDEGRKREEILERFRNENFVLAGTIFGEGVDIPCLDVVINLEAGRSAIKIFQRLRNLTSFENKSEAIVVDFIDTDNYYLLAQGIERINTLSAEKSFDVRVYSIDEFKNLYQ